MAGGGRGPRGAECWKAGREEDVIFTSLTETETLLTEKKLDCLLPTESLYLSTSKVKGEVDSWRLTNEADRRNHKALEIKPLLGQV
jgi:hypothetical protein